jgi:hypothetical protein
LKDRARLSRIARPLSATVASPEGIQDPATPPLPQSATTTSTAEIIDLGARESLPLDPAASYNESPTDRVASTQPDPRMAESQRITLEPGSVARPEHDIDPNPRGLSLTDDEIRFIQALAPMVTTPRAGKRLVNIYRMIRSTQATGGHSRFLSVGPDGGGDYRAVLQLLAIISGLPQLTAPMFTMLLQAQPTMSWPAFVDGLLPETTPPNRNKIMGA